MTGPPIETKDERRLARWARLIQSVTSLMEYFDPEVDEFVLESLEIHVEDLWRDLESKEEDE